MSNASLDENRIPSILAVKNTDGTSLVKVTADPTTHVLNVVDDTTGTDLSTNVNDLRDENRKVAFMAVSSVDGVTPVEVYCDENGKLLINSK